MSFELPTELIDKIMEQVEEPIIDKIKKLSLIDITKLQEEVKSTYDYKCGLLKNKYRRYKNCIVEIVNLDCQENEKDLLYFIEYLNKRDIRVNPVVSEKNINKHQHLVDTGVLNKTINGVKYSIIINVCQWIKYEDFEDIKLMLDIPLISFNYNRGIKD
jgi:hypothetical protein